MSGKGGENWRFARGKRKDERRGKSDRQCEREGREKKR